MATSKLPKSKSDEYVKLVSSDGHEFYIKKSIARISKKIEGKLNSPEGRQQKILVIETEDMMSHSIQSICCFCQYKSYYDGSNKLIPEFEIDEKEAFDLLIAANFFEL